MNSLPLPSCPPHSAQDPEEYKCIDFWVHHLRFASVFISRGGFILWDDRRNHWGKDAHVQENVDAADWRRISENEGGSNWNTQTVWTAQTVYTTAETLKQYTRRQKYGWLHWNHLYADLARDIGKKVGYLGMRNYTRTPHIWCHCCKK